MEGTVKKERFAGSSSYGRKKTPNFRTKSSEASSTMSMSLSVENAKGRETTTTKIT